MRTLGNTGLQVSEIGIGAWQLGGPLVLDGRQDGHPDLGADAVVDLIRQVGELGVNVIDTAEQYGAGESERRVGRAIAGQRARWVVSTKWGAWQGPGGERVNDASAARLPASLEGSLRRLGTDHLDIYLYHVPPSREEAERAAPLLQRLRAEGKVRAVGVSTGDVDLARMLHGFGVLDVVQYPHSLLSVPADLMALQRETGAGGMVRGVFAGGRLSGRYFRQPPAFAPDDIRANWFPRERDALAGAFGKYAALEAWTTPERGMVQTALRWVLDEPATHTVILGAKAAGDYAAALEAVSLPPLTQAERAGLAAVAAAL